ncbi:MAG: sensor histidine kinase [Tissierellia bacterium]|nr:sensor histidine kinase [Tissierellia bacterium]
MLLYIYDDLNPIAFGLGSGASLLLFRWLLYGVFQGISLQQFYYTAPESIFYIVYGIVFYIIRRNAVSMTYLRIFIISVATDMISNIFETYLRLGRQLFTMGYEIGRALLLVGIIRGALVCLMVMIYRYYRLFLIKEEHEERYRNLLQLISQLKTETYWMEKNMDYIERVMSNAYRLFSDISEERNERNWGKEALGIAKDIHEIKKEYALVVMGMEDIMANRLDDAGMYFDELLDILQKSLEVEARDQHKNIEVQCDVGENFYTCNHYYLMSILRNIAMNSIDSIDTRGRITISHAIQSEFHRFTIEDDGEGIEKNDLPNIFSPGYSTKIDYSTGEINRGLGLALVDSIIGEHLRGSIEVRSEVGKGSSFLISIPIRELEGVER